MKRAAVISLLALLVPALALPQPAGRMDSDLLDPQWFEVEGEWRHTAPVDFLWVKPGFSLQGRTIRLDPWPEPVLLGKERDKRDSSLVIRLSDSMPRRLERSLGSALAGYAEVSRETGDIVLTGRFVDGNAGPRAPRWAAAGAANIANATWDVKLVDADSGETLAALHHRVFSGVVSHDLDERLDEWVRKELAPALRDDLAL
ncbi:MAG TPA: hypothetical protein VFR31_04455 [Thermoanaerobaculia bacterium]|nr:hypothetical protein [Thermoanaerobaculia bacterium]